MAGLGKIIFIPVCLSIFGFVTGCISPAETSTIPIGNALITVEPCVDDPEDDVHFENVTVTTGTLDKDYPYATPAPLRTGDPCFLIHGWITNDSTTGYWVAYHAHGYDAAGNEVSFTLETGPVLGIEQIYLEPGSTEEFTLHLSWSEDAVSFAVQSQKSEIIFP